MCAISLYHRQLVLEKTTTGGGSVSRAAGLQSWQIDAGFWQETTAPCQVNLSMVQLL